MQVLVLPISVCLLAMAAETILAGKSPDAVLRHLRQPRWAPNIRAWYAIGLIYYAACFAALFGLSRKGGVLQSWTFWVVIAIMMANAGWNWLFFRRRALLVANVFFVPYLILVAGLLISLFGRHTVAFLLFAIYGIYLPYAFAWSFHVWKLNRE
jgi:tryptophan-rich sensory protein